MGEINEAIPQQNKRDWKHLCSQETLLNRPGQPPISKYKCAGTALPSFSRRPNANLNPPPPSLVSVVFYAAPSPRINKVASEDWTIIHIPHPTSRCSWTSPSPASPKWRAIHYGTSPSATTSPAQHLVDTPNRSESATRGQRGTRRHPRGRTAPTTRGMWPNWSAG